MFPDLFLCVQHGACVNAMDLWQFTPLHEAASKNRVEVRDSALLINYNDGGVMKSDGVSEPFFQFMVKGKIHYRKIHSG